MRICSVTVLYNPEPSIVDIIESYYSNVEQCIIVDNSVVPNEKIYQQLRAKFPTIEIIPNKANLGIGEGFNIGFRYAEQHGFSWVLTMDQDSKYNDSSFFDYAKTMLEDNIAIISPDHFIQPPSKAIFKEFSTKDELEVMASGNLVRVSDWKEIGGYDVDLFIDEVDNDFCLRLGRAGKRIVRIENCFLFHNLGYLRTSWTGSGREFHFHTPMRYFYMYRNYFYIRDKYESEHPEWIAGKRKFMRKLPKYILFYGDNFLSSWKYMYKGYRAYKRGEMGPYLGK